jgi:hypothetical protein
MASTVAMTDRSLARGACPVHDPSTRDRSPESRTVPARRAAVSEMPLDCGSAATLLDAPRTENSPVAVKSNGVKLTKHCAVEGPTDVPPSRRSLVHRTCAAAGPGAAPKSAGSVSSARTLFGGVGARPRPRGGRSRGAMGVRRRRKQVCDRGRGTIPAQMRRADRHDDSRIRHRGDEGPTQYLLADRPQERDGEHNDEEAGKDGSKGADFLHGARPSRPARTNSRNTRLISHCNLGRRDCLIQPTERFTVFGSTLEAVLPLPRKPTCRRPTPRIGGTRVSGYTIRLPHPDSRLPATGSARVSATASAAGCQARGSVKQKPRRRSRGFLRSRAARSGGRCESSSAASAFSRSEERLP